MNQLRAADMEQRRAGRVAGKRCLITGGGGGIGRAIALALAREGAEIAILDRDERFVDAAVRELDETGASSVGLVGDVSSETSVEACFKEAEGVLGGIDVLFNNAGIMSYATVETMPVSMWDEMMAINLRSVFLCSRLAIPGMKARGWGRIISTSSQLAHRGALELAHYAASKAAIIGFTHALAREVIRYGINVNAICPGPIDTALSRTNSPEWRAELTAQIPIGRYGEVGEIAPTAVLLASDEGSFYVGATLNPNGGDVMI